jgi:hypothetical protein
MANDFLGRVVTGYSSSTAQSEEWSPIEWCSQMVAVSLVT